MQVCLGNLGDECRLTPAQPAEEFGPAISREGAKDSMGWITGKANLTAQKSGVILSGGTENADLIGQPRVGSFLVDCTKLIP